MSSIPQRGGPVKGSRLVEAHARTKCGAKPTCTFNVKCFKVVTSCKNRHKARTNVAQYIRAHVKAIHAIINRKAGLDTPVREFQAVLLDNSLSCF